MIMATIRTVYINGADKSGFTFGVDSVTPTTWKFSNRVPKSAYASFALGEIADNPKVQEWIQQNKTVIMSKIELQNKLKQLAGVR
jgi:hypothetical protein